MASLQAAEALFSELECGRVLSLCGRYSLWIVTTIGIGWPEPIIVGTRGSTLSCRKALLLRCKLLTNVNENDEFVQPTALHDAQQAPRGIGPKDSVIFMNFRADRARQLTRTMSEARLHRIRKTLLCSSRKLHHPHPIR